MTTTASNLRVIITGASGMVGEGVLHECLRNLDVSDRPRNGSGVLVNNLLEEMSRYDTRLPP